MSDSAEVIIIGGGVMGCGVAYFLAGEGMRVTVVEKESVASGASGVAAAMLGHSLVSDPRLALSELSLRIHADLSRTLAEEAGVDYGYRENPELYAAFDDGSAAALKADEPAFRAVQADARWVEGPALFEVEPRLNPSTRGAIVVHQAQVIASKFTLALATAAERRGATIRHGEVVGLVREGLRATGVRLANGEVLPAGAVVIAAGAWSGAATEWTGVRIPVYPVRGQILHLLAPDPQLRTAIFGPEIYLVLKADGATLAGATHEHDAGFVVATTPDALAELMEAAVEMTPFLAEAKLVHQVAGLRPGTPDELPMIGAVPGWDGLYMIAGHYTRGMELSAGSARVVADLVLGRPSPIDIAAFDPGRFGVT